MSAPFTPEQEARISELIAEALQARDRAAFEVFHEAAGSMAQSLKGIASIERAREQRFQDAPNMADLMTPSSEMEERH